MKKLYKTESNYSIKRRLSMAHGFRMDSIVLLEGTYHFGKCTGIAFALNGVGMCSDFHDFILAPQYNCDYDPYPIY